MNFKYYNTRNLILFIISLAVVLGFIYAYFIHPAIEESPEPLKSLIIYTEMFSVPFFVYLLFLYIDKKGWQNKCFYWLIEIPNLNGRYKGELISSYTDSEGKPILKDFILEIKQTASSIKISSYSSDKGKDVQTSSSYSVSEEILKDPHNFFNLYFIYSNEPHTLQSKVFNQQTQIGTHYGFQKLKYFPDARFLEGEYFNQRQNIGTVKVTFEGKKLLGRFS